MGWLWGSSTPSDPTKKLDPELRDYLQQEKPATYTPTADVPSSSSSPAANESQTTSSSTTENTVPAASLFPDGRYAHLWKTYKPLAEAEGTHTQAAAERAIDSFKRRKDTVHDAAMENCALEHESLMTCFHKGDWWTLVKAKATMCGEENRKFSRCYTTQAVRLYFFSPHLSLPLFLTTALGLDKD